MLTSAGLIKLFLLELPTPLLTYERYHDFLQALLEDGGPTAAADAAERIPPCNRAIARRLLAFLHDHVVLGAEDAAAAEARLALVFGPLLLRPREDELSRVMKDMPRVCAATEVLIKHSAHIFGHSCWFMRPWMGVYALREGKRGEGDAEAGETILEIDADGIIWCIHGPLPASRT